MRNSTGVMDWKDKNRLALKNESESDVHHRDTIASMGRSELKFTRNKAYSFNATLSVSELQGKVRVGVMQFRRRLV